MREFKEGTRVTLVKHELDSDMNLKIGDTGTVVVVGIKRIRVLWDNPLHYNSWWVNRACIEDNELVEENE